MLGLSLKYLWGMVNVLQFIIYMQQWKVNWPANANLAVKTLRTIALGEFIDTKKMSNSILAFYGIIIGNNSEQTDNLTAEAQSDAGQSGRLLQDEPEVELTTIGTKVRSIAIFVTIIIIIVVILALSLTVCIFYKINKWFKTKLVHFMRKTKDSIFWNGIIRFYL